MADNSNKVWHPIQVRYSVIFMWVNALKQFNPWYKDINIDETMEMKNNLERIPAKELIYRATIVDQDSDIHIDHLVCQPLSNQDMIQSKTSAASENVPEENPYLYSMSFLTKPNHF